MRSRAFALVLAGGVLIALAAFAARANAGITRSVSSGGTVSMPGGSIPTPTPGATNLWDELGSLGADTDADTGDEGGAVDRTLPVTHPGHSVSVHAGKKAKSNPELGKTWNGLGFFDQRFANGGNQFSVEPPDQGLCVGNGYVVESTNDVLRIYKTDGSAVGGVVDLNTFYNYPAAINRATGARGPSITDPVCYYDPVAQRFVEIVLTLDNVPFGQFGAGNNTGRNHFDIAVSNTADPTGSWTIYTVPTQNDGTEGTPDHGCRAGNPAATWRTNPRACLADYPHVGADRNGIYITSNEFEFFNNGFVGADVYAFPKSQLYSGASSLTVWEQSTNGMGPDGAGFTVWSATSPGTQYSDEANGTEYFLSSRAVFTNDGVSDSILTWALTNTASLNTASPALNLSVVPVDSQEYAVPGRSAQKAGGSLPLMECLNTVAGCYAATGGVFHGTEVMSRLDSNDSRFTGVAYANGKLWGALGTGVDTGSGDEAGIGWFIVKPTASGSTVTASMALQGILAGDNVNYTYPSIAVTQSGRGAMGFTIVGPNDYPSAGYAPIDASVGAGAVHVAAAGAGPQDGFSGYQAFRQTRPSARPRWGDYGAAVVDGKSIWMAHEYINQTCTLAQYMGAGFGTPTFGTCGNTRGALGNWSTRIYQVTP